VTTEPVRVAVVGVGYWGPNLVRNLVEHEGAEVACVCDRDPAALARVKQRYPWIPTTTALDAVLGDDGVEAIAIATPVSTHGRLARDALGAGKHVLVEKPLAASAAEALDLIELARRRDLVLMPGHTFLYSPPVNLVRDYIAADELGEIFFISTSRVNLGLHQPDVSVVWDLAPHDFSILCYWLGERPTTVNAISRCCIIHSVPDIAFVNLEFPSGTIAHVELSWLAPSKLRRTTVVGSRKMVVYEDTSPEPVRLFDSGVALRDPQSFGEYRMSYRTGSIVSPRVEPVEPLFVEVGDFLRSVRTGSTPRSDTDLGLDVVLTIEAAERSLAAGGASVEVERSSRSLLGARSR
jgi:predicted dehydrogenase